MNTPTLTPTPPSRSTPDCLLTLAVPKALEEEILDALLSLPTLAPGFTVVPGQGIGRHVELASTMEQVPAACWCKWPWSRPRYSP